MYSFILLVQSSESDNPNLYHLRVQYLSDRTTKISKEMTVTNNIVVRFKGTVRMEDGVCNGLVEVCSVLFYSLLYSFNSMCI
jgi:hypothetical protein